VKYRIDDLGWDSFERLVQSLLKAVIGPGITNWSGHSDRGKDAYCPTDLRFPERGTLSSGPFIFQIKFIAGANAAGARSFGALEKAVRAEVAEIRLRVQRTQWTKPGSYVLVTNAPMTPTHKSAVCEMIRDVAPNAEIYPLGATDVCDLLDAKPSIRQAHPEILGLGDLQELIREAVHSSIRERSAAAIREAEEISRVFVGTRAYERAYALLQDHNFVVLDGPPEMGKTAIARMIALTKVFEGWMAIECRGPDDFFGAMDKGERQVFVADDALGRTEYDVTLRRVWEKDLPRVLLETDDKHWLVWTSRRHILARALADMDLTSRAKNFPHPSELIVDATSLSTEEKARMLYRHAKQAELSDGARAVARTHAKDIVESKFFTPERIRRFVNDALPGIVSSIDENVATSGKLGPLIDDAIQSPTPRMRKAFAGLPVAHRDLLIDMLECDRYCGFEELSAITRRKQRVVTEEALGAMVEDLTGSFLKEMRYGTLDWIHPSYRDVVIDSVSEDAALQVEFLRKASIRGLRLAFSTEGGEAGKRNVPFLRSAASWDAAGKRLAALVQGPELPEALDIVHGIMLATDSMPAAGAGYANGLAEEVLDSLCSSFDNDRPLSTQEIRTLYNVFSMGGLAPRFNFLPVDDLPPPNLQLRPYLRSRLTTIKSELETHREFNSALAEEIVALVNWVQRFEPRGLFDSTIKTNLDAIIERMYEYAASRTTDELNDDVDSYALMQEYRCLSDVFESINYGDIERAEETASMLLDKWAELYSRYDEEEEEDQEADLIDSDTLLDEGEAGKFDIHALFDDL